MNHELHAPSNPPLQACRAAPLAAGLILAASLVACGGGGGGGAAAPAPGGDPGANGCQTVTAASSGLILSEVASNFGNTSGPWFEVYNASATALDLSTYSVRAGTTDGTGSTDSTPTTFRLPSRSVAPGEYLVIASKSTSAGSSADGQGVVYVELNGRFPHWQANGSIELVSGGSTRDAVRFGSSTAATTSSCGWAGANVAALPSSPSDFGRSIVRRQATIGTKSNAAADWTLVSFTTPGGPNDIAPDAVDADNDGIPDSAEVPGGRYAGLDLHAMGARVTQPDIFVQIDHMGAGTGIWAGEEAGWTPQRRALDKVTAAFARRGFAVHFDVGSVLGDTVGTGYNLGAGSQVPFAPCVYFDITKPAANCSYAFQPKATSMPANRRNVFHYVLMAATHSEGALGQAELGGNDVLLTQGDEQRGRRNPVWIGNTQAHGLMHELGHNLGLRHGGFEDRNYKPNYYSIMNYLYRPGLAVNVRGEGTMQRWYGARGKDIQLDQIINSPLNEDFYIDFSDGSSIQLDGRSLLESELIGRGADPGVYADWNGNGVIDTARYGVATALTAMPLAGYFDPDGAQPMRDYNDWSNLQLAFARRVVGTSGILSVAGPRAPLARPAIDPLINDRQESIIELPNELPPFATRPVVPLAR